MEMIIGIILVSLFVGLTSFAISRTHKLKQKSLQSMNIENICYNLAQIVKSDSYFYQKVHYYFDAPYDSDGIIIEDTTEKRKTINMYFDEYGNLSTRGNYLFNIKITVDITKSTVKTDIVYRITGYLQVKGDDTTKAGGVYQIKKVEKPE